MKAKYGQEWDAYTAAVPSSYLPLPCCGGGGKAASITQDKAESVEETAQLASSGQ